jgi:hypothetical protein
LCEWFYAFRICARLVSCAAEPNRFPAATAGQDKNILYLLSVVADGWLNVQSKDSAFAAGVAETKRNTESRIQEKTRATEVALVGYSKLAKRI